MPPIIKKLNQICLSPEDRKTIEGLIRDAHWAGIEDTAVLYIVVIVVVLVVNIVALFIN